LNEDAINDLYVWIAVVKETKIQMPIPSPYSNCPRYCKLFVSDAAGYSDRNSQDSPGVATVGFSEKEILFFAFCHFWSKEMITMNDYMGKNFGHKTAFLEIVGLLIPFLTVPHLVINQHIVMKVDNLACYYGWLNKNMAGDAYASIILRSIFLITCYLLCVLHVDHLPRMSTWEGRLTD